MKTQIEQIRIFSENGDPRYPAEMVIEMDGNHTSGPINFYSDGMPIFSIGLSEVPEFMDQIAKMVP